MQPVILRYGLRACAAMFVLFLLAFILGKGASYSTQEVLGYLAIFTSLSLVYFAIRHYRDTEGGGRVSLGQGLMVGMGVAALAGIGSAIADVIYTTVIYPDFVTEYTAYTLENMRAELPAEEFAAAKEELLQTVKTTGTPIMMALVMFATIVAIGFIVSLVSSLILGRTTVVKNPT